MTLKELRKSKGLIQQQVADRVGVSLPQFKRYEQKSHIPPLDKAILWGEALGIKIAKFVTLYNKEG